jgi:hypothetical protein
MQITGEVIIRSTIVGDYMVDDNVPLCSHLEGKRCVGSVCDSSKPSLRRQSRAGPCASVQTDVRLPDTMKRFTFERSRYLSSFDI